MQSFTNNANLVNQITIYKAKMPYDPCTVMNSEPLDGDLTLNIKIYRAKMPYDPCTVM